MLHGIDKGSVQTCALFPDLFQCHMLRSEFENYSLECRNIAMAPRNFQEVQKEEGALSRFAGTWPAEHTCF